MAFSLDDVLRKKREIKERADRPTVEWFSLAKKNPVRIRFRQEISTDSANYDSNNGAFVFLNEHTSPYNFIRRAECSYDSEGRCFGCEMVKIEPVIEIDGQKKFGAWAAKSNMYTYIETEENEIKVLSRPAPGTFFDLIYAFHDGDGEGSITQQEFEISKGPKRNDSWNLTPKLKTSFEITNSAELADLTTAVSRKIPYEEQKNFYLPDAKKSETSQAPASQVEASKGFEW